MHLRTIGLGWLLVANTVFAAYVQWQYCEDADRSRELAPSSLAAMMEPVDGGHKLSLKVMLADTIGACDTFTAGLSANLDLEALGWRAVGESAPAPVSCNRRFATPYLVTTVAEFIKEPYPLSTFYTRAQFMHQDQGRIGCITGNITPELGPVVSAALRWGPFAIFMFVLQAGIALTVHGQRRALVEPEEDGPTERPLLPGVGDCLQYLQFVFLTGSLSLRYPGFYQPAVSKLEWFSLFAKGPIARGVVYNGVNDGIYEINGTYGGTYGLALMHQIVGAPTTMDTWLNMVLTVMFVTVGAAVLLECLRLWQRRAVAHVFRPSEPRSDGLRHRLGRVLRVIFSYFTTPVVAISTYQFANAAWLPKYHIALAAILIVIIFGSFTWLLCQIPTRSLGVLVFDHSKRYQRIHNEDSPDDEQRHTQFVIVLFVVAFIRGIAIGGVQVLGPAQLAILGACELVLLAFIYGFQAYPAFSINTVSSFVRLFTLLLMVFFLPDILELKIKSAVGYGILALHAAMLVFGFFATACYDFWRVCRTWPTSPNPDSLHLHHLRHRDAEEPGQSTAHLASPSLHADMPGTPQSPYLHSVHAAESRASLYNPSLADTDRYFRQPRARSLRASLSVDLTSLSAGQALSDTLTLTSPRPPTSRTVSPLSNGPSPHFSPMHGHTHDTTARYSVQDTSSSSPEPSSRSSSSSSGHHQGRISEQSDSDEGRDRVPALGPRWGDYSFRESDLFYAVPQQAPARDWGRTSSPANHGLLPAQGSPVPPNSTIRKVSSGIWSKLTGREEEPPERGFQVSRPPRTREPGAGEEAMLKGRNSDGSEGG